MSKIRISQPLSCALLVLAIAVLTAATSQAQTFSVLHNLGSGFLDPQTPVSPGTMSQGSDGVLYTTSAGGGNYPQEGTVFKITPGGQVTLLYSFGGTFVFAEGAGPGGGLTLGTDGNFYGTTFSGGIYDEGIVFKITPGGTLTKIYDFADGSDGGNPSAAPIQGTDGSFYGTASVGGANHYGTVYKITASGKLTTIHNFAFGEGNDPNGPLVQGKDGNFYGTTTGGGPYGNIGTVFKVTPSGKLTTLYFFDGVHGAEPYAGLVLGSDGNFYGTTFLGGSNQRGVVFKMTPTGKVTVLYNFCPVAGCADGEYIFSGLVQATDGNFYGVASNGGTLQGYGTIYRITSTGTFSVLYTFDLTTGATPVTLMQHTNGLLYGETEAGNTGVYGTFYSLDMGLAPFVTFLPQQSPAKIGASLGIFGQGFTGTTSVSFGGIPATFTVSSDTYLTATVPPGALTGAITVISPGGNLTSNRIFLVTPQIKGFSPTSGAVGTQVQIMGAGLTQTIKATFGGVKATTFTVNSDTQVTATVPTGAKTGKVSIFTTGGSATSSATFTVTP